MIQPDAPYRKKNWLVEAGPNDVHTTPEGENKKKFTDSDTLAQNGDKETILLSPTHSKRR
jgi:hypothetical protein